MTQLWAKLGFVHRTLWAREPFYRWAAVLGPPPLLGAAVAALALGAMHWSATRAPQQAPSAPWAHVTRSVPREGQPFAEATTPMPTVDASGRYVGFNPGWRGAIQQLSVDATQDVTVMRGTVSTFAIGQSTIPLGRIRDAGPPNGLFVGTLNASFVVKQPGLYGFSAQLVRSGTQSANCLLWLETTSHRMTRTTTLNAGAQSTLGYDATEFRLEPGLLRIVMAAGCWRGDQMVGDGEVTLLVRHPGQTALQPAAADELISPIPQRPAQPASDPASPPR